MGIHATITIETAPARFDTVYCHHHGYPAHTGRILLCYYNSPAELARLLDSEGILRLEEDGALVHYRLVLGNEINSSRQAAFNCWEADYHYLFMGGQWWLMKSEDEIVALSQELHTAPRYIIQEQGFRLRDLARACPCLEETSTLN